MIILKIVRWIWSTIICIAFIPLGLVEFIFRYVFDHEHTLEFIAYATNDDTESAYKYLDTWTSMKIANLLTPPLYKEEE